MSVTIDDKITFNDATEMDTNERERPTTPIYLHPDATPQTAEALSLRSQTIPVGTYVMLKSTGAQPVLAALLPITPGTEVNGVSAGLHPSDRVGSAENFTVERVVRGTYRCMGYISGTTDRSCIWLKVAD